MYVVHDWNGSDFTYNFSYYLLTIIVYGFKVSVMSVANIYFKR